MPNPVPPAPRRAEAGAITMMVALMLLILLTLAAVGMSRNSFREVVSSGFQRQGAMSSNVADSGLEWSVYWLDLDNSPSATSGLQSQLVNLKKALLADNSLAGVSKAVSDPSGATNYGFGASGVSDMVLPSPSGVTEGYSLGLTRMGKLPITDISQGNGPGQFAPASGEAILQAPDLWSIRADAQVKQGSVTFVHGVEAWFTTPVQ
jgi:hypothetical protein